MSTANSSTETADDPLYVRIDTQDNSMIGIDIMRHSVGGGMGMNITVTLSEAREIATQLQAAILEEERLETEGL